MMYELNIWKFIKQATTNKFACMLLYVVQSNGSSPGRQGFFMAVNEHGEMMGTIGGGIMEYKLVQLAKKKLAEKKNIFLLKKQIHQKNLAKNRSGMICSGQQTIFLYALQEKDKKTISKIINCLQKNITGLLCINNLGLQFTSNKTSNKQFCFEYNAANNWCYTQILGYKNNLHVIGAGHCSVAFTELMYKLNFTIILYDTRENLNTFVSNNFVHKKIILQNYSQLQTVNFDSNSYIVIMTMGYKTDAIALKAVLNKNAKYIGVLGSKNKMSQLLLQLKQNGIQQKQLDNIYTPIGIKINSQTTYEIAISIAAEIIQLKNTPV